MITSRIEFTELDGRKMDDTPILQENNSAYHRSIFIKVYQKKFEQIMLLRAAYYAAAHT